MKALKIIALVVAALVLLLVIALAAALSFIDPNKQKDRIADLVMQQTGRQLAISGELEWGIWPRLRLAGGPLTLGNAPGFGPEPFLELDSFRFSLATWPLLRSELLVDAVEIGGLRLNLARNAQGVSNWDDLAGSPAPPTEKKTKPAPDGGLPFAALALGGVNISGVQISWHDAGSGQQGQVSDLSFRIAPLRLGEPLELQLELAAHVNQPELAATASLSGTLAYDLRRRLYSLQPLRAELDLHGPTVPGGQAQVTLHTLLDLDEQNGRARIGDLRLEGLGILLAAQVEMDGLNTNRPGLRGEIKADINDLVRLLNTFESPLGQQLAGVRERTIALESEFAAEPARGYIRVPKLEARLLGTMISGHLQAEGIDGKQPRVEGNLKVEGPDFPALLAVGARLVPGADLAALDQALRDLRQRDLLVNADFTSEGEAILVPTFQIRGLATELTSHWRLVNLLNGPPTVAGDLRLNGTNLPLLLRVAAAFTGSPPPAATGAETTDPGRELRQLADRIAAAGHHGFRLTAGLDCDMAAQRASLDELKLQLLGLTLEAKGQARQMHTNPELQLELALAPFNPRTLMGILEIEPPDTADPRALSRLETSLQLAGSPEQFTVAPLELRLDDSRLSGELKVNDLSRQDLAFQLAIDQIDLDRYLPPKSEAPPPTPEAAAAGAAALPLETLQALRVAGELRVGKLKISGLQLENFLLQIKAADGLIRVDPLQTGLYQGNMNGKVEIDARGSEALIKTENRLSGVQVGPLLRDLTGRKERLRGRAEVNYQLATGGVEVDQLKANLDGNAAFGFHDGAVVGVNIGRLLRQTSALAQGRTLAADQREAVTDFTELTGSARISKGLISNQDLRMLSPLLRLSGAGTAHLVSEEVDYLLRATVAATAEGQTGRELTELRGITVPIRVRGTFSDLSFRPELGAEGLQQLQQNLRQLGRQLQEEGVRALERLLPGAPPPGEQPSAEPEKKEESPIPAPLRQLFR